MLTKFDKFSFEHFTLRQALLYYYLGAQNPLGYFTLE
jgi:hypothetical protein